mgnify:CR=1 FL=1
MMGVISKVALNTTFWTQLASGPCAVTFNPTDTIDYVIHNATTQPTVTKGLVALRDIDKSMSLIAGDVLFAKGNGSLILDVS